MYLISTLNFDGLLMVVCPFWCPSIFFQFSINDGAKSAYLACKTEQTSNKLCTSLIFNFASVTAPATSPIYLVKLRPFISLRIDVFWLSVKPLTFRTNAVFFFKLESSRRNSVSSGLDSIEMLDCLSDTFHREDFFISSICSTIIA